MRSYDPDNKTTPLGQLIIYIIIMTVFFICFFISKAQADSIDYDPVEMDPPDITAPPIPTTAPFCTADCQVQDVTVCIPNTQHCTTVQARFCNSLNPATNRCEYQFSAFIQ